MWLPVLSNYNRNVLVPNYNEQSTLGVDYNNRRSCKTQFIKNSSGAIAPYTSNNSCYSKISSEIKNSNTNCCPKMSTVESVQISDDQSINNKESDVSVCSTELTVVIEENGSIDKIEIKSIDDNTEKCRMDSSESKANKEAETEKESDSKDSKSEKVDKLVDKLAGLNRDANNNVCDKMPNDEKSKSISKSDEKARNKENEIISNTFAKPQNSSMTTSYHVYYANGCAVSNTSNHCTNKRMNNKITLSAQSNDLIGANGTMNNAASSTYPQHALNHSAAAHLSAIPYTIYTTGHYSLNGQPTILSIPSNTAIQSSLMNSQSGAQQPPLIAHNTMNQSHNPHHLHHNHYHHSNQSHNSNHSAHLHHYHPQQTANIQQNYHQSNFNHSNSLSQQNNQKNLIKNSNSIKSLSSSVSASSLNSSTTVSNSSASNTICNNNTNKSSIIHSTAYTSTYTNSNSPSSPTASNLTASSTNSNQINQQTNQKDS